MLNRVYLLIVMLTFNKLKVVILTKKLTKLLSSFNNSSNYMITISMIVINKISLLLKILTNRRHMRFTILGVI